MVISARYKQIDKKQVKQELERCSTLENKNWSDRSSRSTTTTPLPITIEHIEDTRQFEPKPKWHAVSPTMLETYKHRLNELLLLIDIPTHVHLCTDIRCTEHKNVIHQIHDDMSLLIVY